MKKKVIIIIAIVAAILILGSLAYFYQDKLFNHSKGTGECKTDLDCVPSTCCHATTCVPLALRPNCSNILCSQVCKPNSLDCGQEICVCKNNKCGTEAK